LNYLSGIRQQKSANITDTPNGKLSLPVFVNQSASDPMQNPKIRQHNSGERGTAPKRALEFKISS
jgi:hypothetical protein